MEKELNSYIDFTDAVKNWVYIELTDRAHEGEIVKLCDDKCYEFVNGIWVESSIMFGYFWPDSPDFEMYREIPEEEALKRLNATA